VIDAARLARAVWLEVLPVAGGYLVRGGADDHIVEVDGGLVRCDCLDSQWRGDGCKHALCVRLHHGDTDVLEALRALVPAPAGRSTQRRVPRSRADPPGSPGSGRTDGSPPVGSGATLSGDRKGQPR